jgi:vitamin K-dependent gamma-carboxylase
MAIDREKGLRAALFEPIDAASVAAFRVGFGLLMLVAVARFFAHGWVDEYFVTPRYFLPYFGFEWVRPWPGAGMHLHFAAMGVLAVLIAVGAFYRVSVALFGVLFAYAHLIDKTNYLNHYYLLICLSVLMAFLPLHRVASVDAWRTRPSPSARVPAWVLWALRAQVGIVYLFGGIAKLKHDWLIDAQPMRIWLAANTDFPVLGPLFNQPWVAHALSCAGAAFDLSIVPLLLWRRSRPFGYAAVVLFHLITARLFQLGMFPWIMMASALIFLPPDWPRRALGTLGRKGREREGVPRTFVASTPRHRAFLLGALGLWFAFHLLMPLRHLLYPGDVCWTEQGFRFSWNVMLMEKDGSADFRVTEPSTGRRWVVAPTDYLTGYQAKMTASQPDMILQLAHIIANDFRSRGVRDPEVRVDAYASLNGRRHARLIDPDVDLARESDGLLPKKWILPLPSDGDGIGAPIALQEERP